MLIRKTPFGLLPFRFKDPEATPFDIETLDPIETPWMAIKEWIPDDEPDLDWFNRPQNRSNPDPDRFDKSQAWQASGVPLGDGYTLVLENS